MRVKIAEKRKKSAKLLQYGVNSVAATAVDFLSFQFFRDIVQTEMVMATFGGNIMGASISFILLQKWVFKGRSEEKKRRKLAKFVAGVLLSMVLNTFMTGWLHYIAGWEVWPARIGAALVAWLLGFWFNRTIVFRKSKF